MVDQMRPLMLLELLRKLMGSILISRINKVLERLGALEPNHRAFVVGGSTERAGMIITLVIEDAKWQQKGAARDVTGHQESV